MIREFVLKVEGAFLPLYMLRIYAFIGLLCAALLALWLSAPTVLIAIILGVALVLSLTEWRAREQQDFRLAATVFETSGNGILITDRNNSVLAINPAFTTITGYTPADIVGKNPKLLSSGRHDQAFYQKLWKTIETEGMWQGEIWNRNKNGAVFAEWLTINTVKNSHGVVTHHIAIFSDITERKKQAERIEYLASHDDLTGLPNRVMFEELLNKALADARRTQTMLAVLFLDLDKFKQVNDTLGHDVGDLLLQKVASTLQSLLRAGDTVARQGGDEFTMVLPNLVLKHDAVQLADKILRALEQPCTLKGHLLQVTISVGIALFPENGEDKNSLLKHADVALYRAKQAGRNNAQFYDATLMAEDISVNKR